jgi:putative salt-induced outer membrane protein
MRFPVLLLAAAPLLLGNADPAAISPQIKTMLDAAMASGNESEVATIVKYASDADKENADAIKKVVADWKKSRADAKTERMQQAGILDLWSGKADLGGYISTGNSETEGVSASLDLVRDGLEWRNKLKLQLDYQRSLGVTTREHYLAAYEPNYKVSDRGYVYGSAQYESDRFLGYTDRYSASVGAGYSVLKGGTTKLDLELGPAYRSTRYTEADIGTQSSIAARGSVDFAVQLIHGLSLTQTGSAYLERYNSTVTGTTALNAKLLGPLAAQLSYNFQYESVPPVGGVKTDTITRAGLSYSF